MLNSLIRLCLKLPFLRVVLDRLNIRGLANIWLRRFPVTRVLPDSRIHYRIRSVDSVLVSREIFAQRAYQGLLPLNGIASFADLGSNCGFFTCFLMGVLRRKDLFGLTIDANPRMVEETNWHIRVNGFKNVRAMWGVVGGETNGKTDAFFLHPDDAGSSRFAKSPPGNITRNRWQRIEVPSLSLDTAWRSHFDDLPCDLLKIDIEGSEASFVDKEANFLRSVEMLVVEIHHWLVDAHCLERTLEALGFRRAKVLATQNETDVRLYLNRTRARSPLDQNLVIGAAS
jgi:FkbM family methyltransferase